MDNPRADKVAVVDEVRQRLGEAAASVVTEYRGLAVAELAELRRNLASAGGDYKIYKNTLVRLAVAGSPHASLEDLLTGPTAIAFVRGDVSAVAKALRDFSRTYPSLVVKGGLLDGDALSAAQLTALADLPPRDVLLARFAGALAAPLSQMAGLLQALPRNLAFGLSALLDQKGGAPPAESEPAETAPTPDPAETAPAAPTPDPAETAETPDPAETAETPDPAEAAETESNASTEEGPTGQPADQEP